MMPFPVVGVICSLRIATLSTMVITGYIPVIGTTIDALSPWLRAKTNRTIPALSDTPAKKVAGVPPMSQLGLNHIRDRRIIATAATPIPCVVAALLAKKPQSPQRPSAPNVRTDHVGISIPSLYCQ